MSPSQPNTFIISSEENVEEKLLSPLNIKTWVEGTVGNNFLSTK